MANIPKIKKGDWLFTCHMEPQQFGEWEFFDNPNKIDFLTLNGSSHSLHCCGLKKITKKYAKWFIKNKLWLHYDNIKEIWVKNPNKPIIYNGFDLDVIDHVNEIFYAYDAYIKHLAEKTKLKYEGV